MARHPVTYLITFACYGCHLHGAGSGSVDTTHHVPGTPVLNEDSEGERRRRFSACTRRLAGLTGICFIKPSRRADKRFGLLTNFHFALIKQGITRIFNGLEDDHAKSPSRKEVQKYLVSISLGFQGALDYS